MKNRWNDLSMELKPKGNDIFDAFKSWFDKLVVGQDRAKEEIINWLLNNIYSIIPKKWPLAVLFFYGPTGVGKTEIAHALAWMTMGDPSALTKIKCEHLDNAWSGSNLVGASKGYIWYNDEPLLWPSIYKPIIEAREKKRASNIISRFPSFNIIVLDEIEKAHPRVHQMLLGLMDDWEVTLTDGTKMNFSNSIIIMTSNIGACAKRDIDEKTPMWFVWHDKVQEKALANKEAFKLFSPEFLGRVDAKVEFDNLTHKNCKEIIDIQVQKMNYIMKSAAELDELTILELELTHPVYNYLISKGFDTSKGARSLIRVFNSEINALLGRSLSDTPWVLEFWGNKAKIVASLVKGKVKFMLSKSNVYRLPQK